MSPRVKPPQVPDLDETAVRAIVMGSDTVARDAFRKHFNKPINQVVQRGYRAYRQFQDAHHLWDTNDERRMTGAFMLHAALHHVLTSVHLLVAGYPVPAGNAMRQYIEAIAMAMLFADDHLSDFAHYQQAKQLYNAQDAVARLGRKKVSARLREFVGLDAAAWKTVMRAREIYHGHSHNSVTSLGFLLDFRKGHGAVLGPHYDPRKHGIYKKEITARVHALSQLAALIAAIDVRFKPGGTHHRATA